MILERKIPNIPLSVFIGEGTRILGDVTIGENSSIWFNAVLRGDEGPIIIGKNTNIQDLCLIHSDLGKGTEIGDWVTIGHGAVVRGAKIGNYVMIGMKSTIMTGAVIGECCIIGANSFVPYNMEYPPGSLIYGSPAKVVRKLGEDESNQGRKVAELYLKLVDDYRAGRIAKRPD
jgi:carbonic anhydrase/acetyltransferase-like protein (isoleucine patch superfamily)